MPQIGETKQGDRLGYKDNIKRIWCACVDCGKERWVALRNIRSGEATPRNLKCTACAGKERGKKQRGHKNPWWKGGRREDKGYIQVYLQPDDFFYPMATANGYVLEHRLVIAKYLGRNLHRWELVHHKHTKYPKGSVEDKQDNRRENLKLVSEDRHNQITILENRIKYLEKILGERQW